MPQYESNVERGIREFGLTYPIVIDSNYELWKAFANRYWPTKYLVDHDGYLRYAHFGEGKYDDTEGVIQELLREREPEIELPPLLEPVRDEDRSGAVCFQPTGELHLGHARGRIGNPGASKLTSSAFTTSQRMSSKKNTSTLADAGLQRASTSVPKELIAELCFAIPRRG